MISARHIPLTLLATFVSSGSFLFAVEPPKGKDFYDKQVLPVLQEFCYDCHGDGMDKGHFAIDKEPEFMTLMRDKKMWDNVREHMESFVMPPENKSQPTKEQRDLVTQWIENDVFWVDPTRPDPGHITLRRLNRVEYNNTVRDVFRVTNRPADSFPPDDTGYGYDNIGDVLSLSPLLMEKYMRAGRAVSDSAIWIRPAEREVMVQDRNDWKITEGQGAVAGPVATLWSNGSLTTKFKLQTEGHYRLSAMLSAQQAGSEKAKFAVKVNGKELTKGDITAEYDQSKPDSNWQRIACDVKLPAGNHRLEVLFLNDANDPGNPDPKKRDRNLLVQSVELAGPTGVQREESSKFITWLLDSKSLKPTPIAFYGEDFDVVEGLVAWNEAAFLATNGTIKRRIWVPGDGEYQVRIFASAEQAGKENAKMKVKVAAEDWGIQEITKPTGQIQEISRKMKLLKGDNDVVISFVNDTMVDGKDRNLIVNRLVVENLNAPHVDVRSPEFTKQWVTKLGTRMFRRELDSKEKEQLYQIAKMTQDAGDSFVESVRVVSEALLSSPRFLFRGGADPDGAVENGSVFVDEYTLASRLSYFLWSSCPDDELLALASKKELRKNLKPQVARMLKDWKAYAMAANFAGQWLQLRDMDLVAPNPRLFPELVGGLRNDMKKESQMFFDFILRGNRSALEFLDSDYTFLNEPLAKFYGIQGVKGKEFREVSLKGTPRGGILTQGSILMLTSHPNRTSPVKRGTFLLENILGTPPPPAPQNIPAFGEDRGAKVTGTLRQRFEAHRANPSCAGCHAFLDPMGFAFENYDAIGRWRANDNGQPIDPTGKLLTGQKFDNAEQLRKLLVSDKKDDFVKCLVKNLLIYSMGRGLEFSDKLFIKQISQQAEENGYKFQDIIVSVIESVPFQKMRAIEPVKPAENVPQAEPKKVAEN